MDRTREVDPGIGQKWWGLTESLVLEEAGGDDELLMVRARLPGCPHRRPQAGCDLEPGNRSKAPTRGGFVEAAKVIQVLATEPAVCRALVHRVTPGCSPTDDRHTAGDRRRTNRCCRTRRMRPYGAR